MVRRSPIGSSTLGCGCGSQWWRRSTWKSSMRRRKYVNPPTQPPFRKEGATTNPSQTLTLALRQNYFLIRIKRLACLAISSILMSHMLSHLSSTPCKLIITPTPILTLTLIRILTCLTQITLLSTMTKNLHLAYNIKKAMHCSYQYW